MLSTVILFIACLSMWAVEQSNAHMGLYLSQPRLPLNSLREESSVSGEVLRTKNFLLQQGLLFWLILQGQWRLFLKVEQFQLGMGQGILSLPDQMCFRECFANLIPV